MHSSYAKQVSAKSGGQRGGQTDGIGRTDRPTDGKTDGRTDLVKTIGIAKILAVA